LPVVGWQAAQQDDDVAHPDMSMTVPHKTINSVVFMLFNRAWLMSNAESLSGHPSSPKFQQKPRQESGQQKHYKQSTKVETLNRPSVSAAM